MARNSEPVALAAYEALARRYAALVDSKAENAYYERPATLSLLPPVAGKRLLDAGCGPGAYAELLTRDGAEVVGIDVSPRMLRLARRRLGKRAELHLVDLGKPLDFLEPEAYDIVLCPLVLVYVEDWGGDLREFRLVLQGFGVLVFSVGHPFRGYLWHTETSYYETVLVEDIWKGFGIDVAVPYYRRSLSSMLTPLLTAGFTLEQIVEPCPGEDVKAADPGAYERLKELPGFLCVRARKSTASRPVKNGRLRR